MKKELSFYTEHVEPIKEGVKTSTLRLHFDGKIDDKMDACDVDIPILSKGSSVFGSVIIRRILYVRFDEINKEIAKTAGYLHENLLKEALYNTYPDLEDSSLLYYIVFEFYEKE